MPVHPRSELVADDVDESALSDEDRAYRSWVNYLRETGGAPERSEPDDPSGPAGGTSR
jgi:hypothetical protein